MHVVNEETKENKSEALKDKYMLTIKEAAFYFNIGTDTVVLIKGGFREIVTDA